MATKTEPKRLSDWLAWEVDARYARKVVTVLAGSGADRVLTEGMVLGAVTKGAATAAAKAGGNSGNGTFGTITVGADAKPGVYRLTIIEPATDAGAFMVQDPDGIVIGSGTVAVAFSAGGLGFTLGDGSNNFVAGDAFDITVAAGSGKVVQLDLAGTTGIEDAIGVLIGPTTAPASVDASGVMLVRGPAVVKTNGLVWPAGITSDQKNIALAQLERAGILARTDV